MYILFAAVIASVLSGVATVGLFRTRGWAGLPRILLTFGAGIGVVVFLVATFAPLRSENIEVVDQLERNVGEFTLINISQDRDATTYVEITNNTSYSFVYFSPDGQITSARIDAKDVEDTLFLFNMVQSAEKPKVSIRDKITKVKRWALFTYVDDEIVERQYTFTIPEGTVKGLPDEN